MLCKPAAYDAGMVHPAMGFSETVPVVSVMEELGPGAKCSDPCFATRRAPLNRTMPAR